MERSTKSTLLVEGLVLAAWLVIIALLKSVFMRPDVYMVSYLAGIFSFVASALMLVYNDTRKAQAALVEVHMLTDMVPVVYFVAALLANGAFCLLSYAWFSVKFPLIANIILMVVALLVMVGTASYSQRASADLERAAQPLAQNAAIGARVAQLLATASAPEVKAALLKLKQEVDYSSAVAGQSAAAAEGEFLSQLAVVESALASGQPVETVVVLIEQAQKLWRKRNAMVSTIR